MIKEYPQIFELREILEDNVVNLDKDELRQRLFWSLEPVEEPRIPKEIEIKIIHTKDDSVVNIEEFET